MIRTLFFLLILVLQAALFAQPGNQSDLQLGQHYYSKGEFEKASVYYEKVYAKDPSKQVFLRYVDCLMNTKELSKVEKLYKRQINMNRQDVDLRVSLGHFYEEIGDQEKAENTFSDLIKNLPPSPTKIMELYRSFVGKNKLNYALDCLKKGKKICSNGFEFQFADLYFLTGNKQEMIKVLIDFLGKQPDMIDAIQDFLSTKLNLENQESADYILTKELLITAAQKNNSPIIISELVSWLFIQSKNFIAAYNQTVSLEKRLNSDGYKIFDLAIICMENKAFEAARKCYNYLINLPNSEYLVEAQRGLLNARYLEITTNRNYSETEINATLLEYEQALNRFGKTVKTQSILLEYAHILAYYAGKSENAITLLKETLSITGLTDMQKGQIKMLLADIYVLTNDIWEASLLYMQVDKDFKYEAIGNEAKFKNAKIFYFDGEFDYAQSQLSVLKESTSKLISNDAIQLSVAITDNYGLDSNFQAMFWFAQSALLIEQHKYIQAFALMDSIRINYPFPSLADEILMEKGQAMEMQGKWTDAIEYYEDVLKFHSKDILADDALFRIADIKENVLKQKEEALTDYKRLLIEYKASLYGSEVRKRVRSLRGDLVDDSDL